jgi:4'-phosphopantetheinyl transferase
MQGVEVWRASLERSADEVAALYALLDPVERSRAARFIDERDRRRFVVARGTLRLLLGEYTATAPQYVRLCVLPGGKPALARENGLHFNLSHCGELALFAFADREVGIDVERVVDHREMQAVAAHFFSSDEAAALRRLAGNERARFFCRTWVRKEAYLKATGDGFAIDPARLSIADLPANRVALENHNGIRCIDDRYSVHDLPEIDNHFAAVAVGDAKNSLRLSSEDHHSTMAGRLNAKKSAPPLYPVKVRSVLFCRTTRNATSAPLMTLVDPLSKLTVCDGKYIVPFITLLEPALKTLVRFGAAGSE